MTQAPTRAGVVCAGNFIVDRIHLIDYFPAEGNLAHILSEDRGLGGGAANVACDLKSLGLPAPVSVAGAVGQDDDGSFVRDSLCARGIAADSLKSIDNAATAHTLVMSLPGKSRTFFYHGGAGDQVRAQDFDAALFGQQGHRFFYLGYLMLLPGLDAVGADGRSGASHLLDAARAAGMETVVDCVSSEDESFAQSVSSALPFVDHLVINEIEAGRITALQIRKDDGTLDRQTLHMAGERLIALGTRATVVIHAPEGCLWLARNGVALFVAGETVPKERIVSPVGAGDAFCAGVIYGLHEGWSAEKTARMAHKVAARSLEGMTATDGIPPMAELLREP